LEGVFRSFIFIFYFYFLFLFFLRKFLGIASGIFGDGVAVHISCAVGVPFVDWGKCHPEVGGVK